MHHSVFSINHIRSLCVFNFIKIPLQLVELSRAQDIEAGDGTTSVVVIAGALMDAAEKLLHRGIHPTAISESFQRAAILALDVSEINI